MNLILSPQWRTWWQLLRRDLHIFRSSGVDYFINTMLWPIQAAIAFGYIFPLMGVGESYGANIILATVVYKCMYESYFQSSEVVADLNGARSIDFMYTLPVSPKMIMLKNITYFIIKCFVLCAPIIAISKLILQDRFAMDQWNIAHSIIAFFCTALFFACFSVWLTGWVKNQIGFEHVWVRILDTLNLWGGFWFTWQTLYTFAKPLAYITLLNPFTLGLEAMRSSFFGPAIALPFWPCIGGLLLETAIMAIIGYRRLKKRLDFVD